MFICIELALLVVQNLIILAFCFSNKLCKYNRKLMKHLKTRASFKTVIKYANLLNYQCLFEKCNKSKTAYVKVLSRLNFLFQLKSCNFTAFTYILIYYSYNVRTFTLSY